MLYIYVYIHIYNITFPVDWTLVSDTCQQRKTWVYPRWGVSASTTHNTSNPGIGTQIWLLHSRKRGWTSQQVDHNRNMSVWQHPGRCEGRSECLTICRALPCSLTDSDSTRAGWQLWLSAGLPDNIARDIYGLKSSVLLSTLRNVF